MEDICIIGTGGTIDKDHDPITEKLVFSESSHIPTMLSEFRVPEIPHSILMLKDSLEMTDADREIIRDAILKRSEKCIVITHGTSTMSETAVYLKKYIQDKVIVLTGAMRPFSLFQSDAGFNLGAAIVSARLLSNGVYIAMNGQVFKAGEVQKDTDKGIFI